MNTYCKVFPHATISVFLCVLVCQSALAGSECSVLVNMFFDGTKAALLISRKRREQRSPPLAVRVGQLSCSCVLKDGVSSC